MGNKRKVVVAMSGGVDSSVSAGLLVEQGYDVHGIMMRLWSESGQATKRDNRCCTRDQMIDAHAVSKKLGIPFEVIDARDTFKSKIVDHFVDGYSKGLTPNPCLACNREIRFTFLLEQALDRGAEFLATGHYARKTIGTGGEHELLIGRDVNKDQSYVLSVLNQYQLSHALFPIGEYSKVAVRELASQMGLRVANKSESQDLCFIADGNYRRFLRDNLPDSNVSGPILSVAGEKLGTHTGLMDYTIGQRKGLGISYSEPLYVVNKELRSNTLVVGTKDDLGLVEFCAINTHWISGTKPTSAFEADVKIRYKAAPKHALIEPISDDSVHVLLSEPAIDVTPGQGLVIYDGEKVLGSGSIRTVIPSQI